MIDLVQKEFSRRSDTYRKYNFLQKDIAKFLLSFIGDTPKHILDLGAGQGEVYSLIDWEFDRFTAVEFAPNMIERHPINPKVTIKDLDFNKPFAKDLDRFDIVISSSSLQWAKDLDFTLKEIAQLTDRVAFSIFTDNTFKTIRDLTKVSTFLRSSEEIITTVSKYFNVTSEVKNYTLKFNTKKELFEYIKKSGVSGGEKKLSYRQTKDLINSYPKLELEAEVVFLHC